MSHCPPCHQNECKHRRLTLCETCQNVYCQDCKKEWYKDRSTYWTYTGGISPGFPHPASTGTSSAQNFDINATAACH